jgi:coenzyme F420-0:L-glutamate ligase/coenzyme F420-1:gamma-L-glutamate ligase
MPEPDLQLFALRGLPSIQQGDDLAALIADALRTNGLRLQAGDILVVTSKIISKAEGRLVDLRTVQPSAQAQALAAQTGKDARVVELVLREAQSISRVGAKVIITRHRLGFIAANSGVDQSNVRGDDNWALLLPEHPDRSARALRERLSALCGVAPAVIVSDTQGRAHRLGNVGVAIGVAGMAALLDLRGRADLFGRRLQHTEIGVADELAAAAELISGQAAESLPVVLIRGYRLPDGAPADGSAADLYRPPHMDLYS